MTEGLRGSRPDIVGSESLVFPNRTGKVAARIEALSAENEALSRENAAYTLQKGAEWILAKLWEIADDEEVSGASRVRSLHLIGKDAGMFGPECGVCRDRERVSLLSEEECLAELETLLHRDSPGR